MATTREIFSKDALKLTRHSAHDQVPVVDPIANEVKLQVYLSAIRPIMIYGSETSAAPATVLEKLNCMERKLFRRLLGYFWPLVCHNKELYSEVDMVYRRMTRGKRQHLARPSEVVMGNHLRFFGHVMRRPSDRLVKVVLKMLPDPNWKRPPSRKRRFWTKVVKENLTTLGVHTQFSRDVKFCRQWNSDGGGSVDSMRTLAEDRTGLSPAFSDVGRYDHRERRSIMSLLKTTSALSKVAIARAIAPRGYPLTSRQHQSHHAFNKDVEVIRNEKSSYKFAVGDLNAKLGNATEEEYRIGRFGLGDRNENGNHLGG
ncbi:hypothetical protein RB195_024204 [Necator americanus]|uniref:Uncharacterized protein n=1 Tax=Necator americanus TaxID=51031 RepID=A0ABR1EME9_NECAM